MRKLLPHAVSWLGWSLKKTCRVRFFRDPRLRLRSAKIPYVYAVLHGEHVLALLAHDEPAVAAMVSRSRDGDVLQRLLALLHVRAVRGSTGYGRGSKGGGEALVALASVVTPSMPGMLVVDGPRGPYGHVHRGIARLVRGRQAMILPVRLRCSWGLTLMHQWDHLRIPLWGARIDAYFANPIAAAATDIDDDWVRNKVQLALHAWPF
jgi:lysophospholipid acyltransferase (LPLAT)-like uncharacterized protein